MAKRFSPKDEFGRWKNSLRETRVLAQSCAREARRSDQISGGTPTLARTPLCRASISICNGRCPPAAEPARGRRNRSARSSAAVIRLLVRSIVLLRLLLILGRILLLRLPVLRLLPVLRWILLLVRVAALILDGIAV